MLILILLYILIFYLYNIYILRSHDKNVFFYFFNNKPIFKDTRLVLHRKIFDHHSCLIRIIFKL